MRLEKGLLGGARFGNQGRGSQGVEGRGEREDGGTNDRSGCLGVRVEVRWQPGTGGRRA